MRTRDAPATRVGVPREVEDGDAYARDGFRTSTTGPDAAAAPPAMRFLRSRRSLRGVMRARARHENAEIAPVDGDGRRVLQDVAARVAAAADGLEARYEPRGPVRLKKEFRRGKATVRRGVFLGERLRALVDREAARERAAALLVVDAVVRGALVVLGPRRVGPGAPLRVADDAVAHAYEQNMPLERDPRPLARSQKHVSGEGRGRPTRARAERLHVVDVDLRAAPRSSDARRGPGGAGRSTAVR